MLRRISGDSLAVIVALAVLAYLLSKHSGFFHDDAYITLRYARTFAETGLIQWNPGEWAEGYTSLLHVVLTGWVMRLGASAVAAAQMVNAIAVFVLLVMTAVAARAVLPGRENRLGRGLTVLTVAGSTPIALWVLGGLEAVVVAALLASGVAALLTYLRRPHTGLLLLAAIAYALAVLTRLDASVFIAGSGLGLLVAGSGTKSARVMGATIVVGIPAAVSFLQMGIRWQIYGELFPLTFYAKADLPLSEKLLNGAEYLSDMLVTIPTLGIALGAVVILRKTAGSTPAVKFLLCATVMQLLYICWAGGDHMPWARMLVPLLAPLALLLLACLTATELQTRNIVVGTSVLATLIVALVEPPKTRDHAAHFGEIIGHHINNTWPEGITIALNTAGATPFFAGQNRTFIDMLGLNDPVIAKRKNVPILTERQSWPGHAKGDGVYVLSRAPDRIIIGPAHGVNVAEAWFLSGKELENLPEFARCYQQVIEPVHYSEYLAARGEEAPNPLRFLYYTRVCP
ncbi:hypothetical protein MWU53_09770 [Aliiroseovarius sp. S1123]|jgi:hypothetical protein|uniref:hypothetical protein n=1 Tax=unclassified Aliiroseovarius TaxID=2623558 RepID=UPI001FF21883|nr:hypothetical protein [Aliiroseovarius sp. S1123]MCK0171343.1 hypothetical protein [Aliiroseovarius sp. S1123]